MLTNLLKSSFSWIETYKNMTLSRSILNSIFIPFIILILLISFFSYIQVKQLIEANNWVVHTYQVIQATDETLYDTLHLETHQRGYLITGDNHFLNEMDELKKNTLKHLHEAISLVKDNPDQHQRALALENIIKRRINYLEQNIQLKKNNEFNTGKGIELFLRGQNDSDEVKAIAKEIKSVELTLLSERNIRAVSAATHTNMILVISTLLSTIVLLFAFSLIKNELRIRDQIEKKRRAAEIRLRSIIENANDMIAALDKEFHFILFNEAYSHEFKKLFHKNIITGMTLSEALSESPEGKEKLFASWESSLQGNEYTETVEFNIKGQKNVYEVTSSLIKSDEEITGAVHIIRNITPRIQEQLELQASYQKLNDSMIELQKKNHQITALVEMSDIMLASNSQEELSRIMAKYCERMLNFSHGFLYIMHPSRNYLEKSSMWGTPGDQDVTLTPDQCWAIRLGRTYHVIDTHDQLVCSHIKNIDSDCTYLCIPLMAQNDIYGMLYLEVHNAHQHLSENQTLLVTAFAELTALGLANAQLRDNLRYQSIRDPLTGLYNRRYLEDFLFKQIHQASRQNAPLALLMLDVDHFKKINDTYGHDAGDEVLKEVGALLQEDIRLGDIAARYGGEEFIIVFYNTTSEAAKKRADQLRNSVSAITIKYGAQQVSRITISIGISEYPQEGKNTDELITAADKALYAAKNTGRNKTVLAKDIDDTRNLKRDPE